MSGQRELMKTVGGMSVRAEIEARLDAAREISRTDALVEAICFLGGAGHLDAAELLRLAAFGESQDSSTQQAQRRPVVGQR